MRKAGRAVSSSFLYTLCQSYICRYIFTQGQNRILAQEHIWEKADHQLKIFRFKFNCRYIHISTTAILLYKVQCELFSS